MSYFLFVSISHPFSTNRPFPEGPHSFTSLHSAAKDADISSAFGNPLGLSREFRGCWLRKRPPQAGGFGFSRTSKTLGTKQDELMRCKGPSEVIADPALQLHATSVILSAVVLVPFSSGFPPPKLDQARFLYFYTLRTRITSYCLPRNCQIFYEFGRRH